MEEAKAAAYYDELTRKGEGAARFKRGLGFSSNDDDNSAPSRGSALASSTSFLSNFVKSSSDPTQISKYEKEAQLQSIQNKLKKNKLKDEPSYKVSGHGDSHRHRHRSRSRDRDRDRDRHNSRRSRSRSRSRERYKERKSDRRNRSRSPSLQGRRRSEKSSRNGDAAPARDRKETNYSKLIRGYENMTAAEKAKARTKLQLNETAEKDTTKGMGSGWERFEFDKDAPLDDEEIEAAEDDVALVKHIGQSFRFSAVEAKKEDQIKVAHDAAMFGAPILGSMISDSETEADNNEKESIKTDVAASLLSEKVLAKQQGSWRDRARKTKE